MAFEEQDYKKAKDTGRNNLLRNTIIGLVLLSIIIVGSYIFGLFVEYIQIKEIGAEYTDLFWINVKVRLIAQLVSLCAIFILFGINSLIIRRISLKDNYDLGIIRRISPMLLVTFIVSFLASRFISDTVYSRFLTFVNSTGFGKIDPVFNQDIGYYIFQRPFLISLVESIRTVLLVQVVYTAIAYVMLYLRGGIDNVGNIIKEKPIVIHVIVNAMLLFLAIALGYRYTAEEVLYHNVGGMIGANYTDIHVWVPYYKMAPYILIIVAGLSIYLLLKGKWKKALISIAAFPGIWVLTAVIAFTVQTLVVAPNEIDMESANISNNIYMTREAYSLDKIIETEFAVNNTLTAADVAKNNATVGNIRVADYNATITASNKLQGIRPYYTFNDTDIVSYEIGGKPVPLSISVRELDKNKITDDTSSASNAYMNRTFKYTHGYGVVASPTNAMTEEGQPDFVVRDIPMVSEEGAPVVAQPRIYYGESTNDNVIVNTKLKELDFTDGKTANEFSYDGTGGISLTWSNRLLFSLLHGDYKMLISNQITKDSKILPNRNIIERVKRIAPFFEYDTDPYMIINNEGRLKWVIDAYATSEYYPYSQFGGKINYIRNSVKAVVDAYDGSVVFYITDFDDPVVQTYKKIYPRLFSAENMPDDIEQHVRYPEYLFKMQADLYKKYHTTDVTVFYNRSDLWDLAKERYNKTDTQYIEPYYNMMAIRGFEEKGEGMLLTMPFTPSNKDYINSWLAVGSDGKYYGKMVLYKFTNAEKNAYGTMQIENRVDNDPKISSEMTLWGQGGSSVIRGNMIVIPVKDSLLYVEPVYITTQNAASFPELKRVIVAYKEAIVMEPTLKEAMAKIFTLQEAKPDAVSSALLPPPSPTPSPTPTPTPPASGPVSDELTTVMNKLVELYASYKDYNKAGDFENAGKVMQQIDGYIKKADDILKGNKSEYKTKESPQASPSNTPSAADDR